MEPSSWLPLCERNSVQRRFLFQFTVVTGPSPVGLGITEALSGVISSRKVQWFGTELAVNSGRKSAGLPWFGAGNGMLNTVKILSFQIGNFLLLTI